MNQELLNVFQAGKEVPTFDRIRISLASPRPDSAVVAR